MVSDPQENSEHRPGGGARRRPSNIGAEQSDNFEAPAGPDGRGFDVALTLTFDALTGCVGRALLPVLYVWGVVLVLGTGADILSALGVPGNKPAVSSSASSSRTAGTSATRRASTSRASGR